MKKSSNSTLVEIGNRIVEEVLAIPENTRLKDTQIFDKLYVLIEQINSRKKYYYSELKTKFYEIRDLKITELKKLVIYVTEKLVREIKKDNSNILNMRIIYALDILGYSLDKLSKGKKVEFLKKLYLVSKEEDVLTLAALSDKVIKEKINLEESKKEIVIQDRLVKRMYDHICAKKFDYRFFDSLNEITYLVENNTYSKDIAKDIMPIFSDYNQKECEIFIDKLSYTLIAKVKEPSITVERSFKIIYALASTEYLDRLHKRKGAWQVTKFAYNLYKQLDYKNRNFRKKLKQCLELSKELDNLAASARKRFTKKQSLIWGCFLLAFVYFSIKIFY